MKTVKDRLLDFLQYLGIGQTSFEESAKISRGLLSKSSGNIAGKTIGKISAAYPELNIDWLLTGEGEMLRKPDETPGAAIMEQPSEILMVPLLPLSAQGGKLNDFVTSVHDYECERIISPIKGAQLAVSVSGDSMAPEYPAGSQVLIKRIDERKFIEWGRAYVIDTSNGVVIKYLAPSDKGDRFIRCISLNPDPRYAPFDVCLEDVYGIYRVLICMSTK